MARKVFLSVLGTGHYKPTTYYFNNDKSTAIESRFIQEASLKYYPKDKFDKIYIFLTEDAKKINWDNPAWKKEIQDPKRYIKDNYTGLSKKLEEFKQLETVNIADGNDEKQIWSIFETIFNVLKEGDEVYFDITHGFRTLPMLLMVLINYSKFLKTIEVEKITYGNWEARDKDSDYAPVIDITSFSEIQDWTNAANQFINGGSAEQFVKLAKQDVAPILRKTKGQDLEAKSLNQLAKTLPDFILDMQTNRGKEIYKNQKAAWINASLSNIERTDFKPIVPLIEKIDQIMNVFSKTDNIKNGFHAVAWCIDNKFTQQAITLLQETIISLICEELDMDYSNELYRELVSKAFKVSKDELHFENWDNVAKKHKNTINTILNSSYYISLLKDDFAGITSLRNDINHAGLLKDASKAKNFAKNVEKYLCSTLKNID